MIHRMRKTAPMMIYRGRAILLIATAGAEKKATRKIYKIVSPQVRILVHELVINCRMLYAYYGKWILQVSLRGSFTS